MRRTVVNTRVGNSFAKDVARSIATSKGRFIAIAMIALLGCGFFAGLQMTAPDMRLALDGYLDDSSAYDLKVVCTFGVDQEMADQIEAMDGVEAVVPHREADVYASIDGRMHPLRFHAMTEEVDKATLVSGRWPQSSDECVLGADAVFDEPVQIGTTVVAEQVSGGTELMDTLDQTTFTVVGFARSSEYVCSSNFGATSLGDGAIDDFVLVEEEAFNCESPFTSALVRVSGAEELEYGSQAYDDAVEPVQDAISAASEQLSGNRRSSVLDAAQKKIDKARAELEASKSDAYGQLDQAQAELSLALAELQRAEISIGSASSQLSDGQTQLAEAKQALEQAREELDRQSAQLEDAKSQLAASEAEAEEQFAATEAQIAEQEQKLANEKPNLAKYKVSLGTAKVALSICQSGKAAAESTLEWLRVNDPESSAIPWLETQVQRFESWEGELESSISELEQAIWFIENGDDLIAASKAELQQTRDAAQREFDAAHENIDALDSQLAAARDQVESSAATIASKEAELEAGERELGSKRSQLDSGWAEYFSGKAEYESGKNQADSKIAEAQSQIDDAQRQADETAIPDLYVLDRGMNIGIASFSNDADRLANIANVFPLIFFLVAALVSLTTMTRMVDEERVLIGTYKALGYSSGKIASKYLLYALLASGVGCLVGILALTRFLPFAIMGAYSIIYVLPGMPTPIDVPIALCSAAFSIGVVLVATVFAVASSLRESPAALMLPRVPKAGKRILLERIAPVWRRFSFSWKVTARNLFRYKKRFVMALIGVAGCTALLLTGFGLSDAINDILDKQFDSDDSIFRYEMTVMFEDDGSGSTIAGMESVLAEDPGAEGHTLITDQNCIARQSDGANLRVQLMVPEDASAISQFVDIRDRATGESLPLGGSGDSQGTGESSGSGGAILSEKLANRLGVGAGDTIVLYDQDATGNPEGDGYSFEVAGVMECYVSNYVYVSRDAYESATGRMAEPGYMMVNTSSNLEEQESLAEKLLQVDGVSTAAPVQEAVLYYRNALKSIDSVVAILIGAAAALAFVVLYNLTNINIAERTREVATLKVLGFTKREVNAYIFRETLLLTVIGGAIGLLLGIFMCTFVVQTAEVDQVMFGRTIHVASFLIAYALTMLFSVVVSLAMMRKLDRISMTDSLKSVD